MAIKGKKKPQRRGGQARRRPATAPRPVVTTGRRTSWFRTSGGMVAIAVVVLAVAGGAGAIIANRAADNERLADRQARLDDYADRLRGVVQDVSETAEAMAAAPAAADDPRVDDLKDQAAAWITSLGEAQGRLSKITLVEGGERAHQLIGEAVGAYINAANAYELVPATDDATRPAQLANASAQRDLAGRLLQAGVEELDATLSSASMEPSGITPPQPPLPGLQPPAGGGPPGDGGGANQDGGKQGAKAGGEGED